MEHKDMMGILKKLSSAAAHRTTYRVGLVQAKAYRILKQKTADVLEPFGITTVEWAFVGLLHDKGPTRPKVLSEELGVEAPFVTTMVAKLEKKDLVSETPDPKDTRAKMIFLTPKGKRFVETTEPIVRTHMRPLASGLGAGDLLSYLAVLEAIIRNGEDQKEDNSKKND